MPPRFSLNTDLTLGVNAPSECCMYYVHTLGHLLLARGPASSFLSMGSSNSGLQQLGLVGWS